jgi:hypothetical protein
VDQYLSEAREGEEIQYTFMAAQVLAAVLQKSPTLVSARNKEFEVNRQLEKFGKQAITWINNNRWTREAMDCREGLLRFQVLFPRLSVQMLQQQTDSDRAGLASICEGAKGIKDRKIDSLRSAHSRSL